MISIIGCRRTNTVYEKSLIFGKKKWLDRKVQKLSDSFLQKKSKSLNMRLLGGSFHPLCTNLLFFCWSWAQKDRDFLLLFPPRCCQLTSMESVRTFDVPKRAMRSKTRKSDRSITTTMAQVLMSGEEKGKGKKCQKIQIFRLGQKFDRRIFDYHIVGHWWRYTTNCLWCFPWLGTCIPPPRIFCTTFLGHHCL